MAICCWGVNHSFAIKTDGSLWAWGNGYLLGDGTSNASNVPKAIVCPTSVLAVDDFEVTNEMKIYPNPIKDILNFSFDAAITTVSIYNLLGQEVIVKSLNANEGTIDVSNLSSGTYFVKVYADNLVRTLKVIKK